MFLPLMLIGPIVMVRCRTGQLDSWRTGLEPPLTLILVATCFSTVVVGNWQVGLPKALGVLLGASAVIIVSGAMSSRQSVGWAIWGLTLAGGILVLVALFGMETTGGKLPLLDPISSKVPAILRGFLPSMPYGLVNPNEVAGVLVLIIPVLLGQLYGVQLVRKWLGYASHQEASVRFPISVVVGSTAIGALLLTQSRGGLISALVELVGLGGLFACSAFHKIGRPVVVRVAVVMAVVGCAAPISVVTWRMAMAYSQFPHITHLADAGLDSTLIVRAELWNRALYMISDFPLTGIGPGQFSRVLHERYPAFLLPDGEEGPHAHNLLLEYLVELGLPGALAFLWMVLVFFSQCHQATRSNDTQLRWTGWGLAFGVMGFLTFGLTDAIAPGARGGLLFWVVLAVGARLGRIASWETHISQEVKSGNHDADA